MALLQIPGIGHVLARTLISYLGSAEAVFRATKAQLMKVPGVGEVLATTIRKPGPLAAAEALLSKAQKQHDHLVFYTDAAFPQRLRQVPDAPLLLYIKGKQGAPLPSLNPERTVAIVGTRQSTDYGRQVTTELVEALVPYGATIVSGLAYGIDAVAHKASLQAQVPTWGVMGTGLDIIYPASHRSLAQQMVADGGLLFSELSYGTKPDGHQFPARNRIIAAIADVVVVVEAARTGGALITADIAHGYGRTVMAVPGNVHHSSSEGCNLLIQQGKAALYSSVQSLIQQMQWEPIGGAGQDGTSTVHQAKQRSLPDDMVAEYKHLLTLMMAKPDFQIDELSRLANVPINQLASQLLNLEFDGWVKTMPGKKFGLQHPIKL